MNTYTFRKAQPGEENIVFELIRQRMDWMNQKGINGWNRMDYLSVYPLEHYREILPEMYVLQEDKTGEILCAGALYESDERWNSEEPALYLHHFTSKVGAYQAGTLFLRRAEEYARSQGKQYLRLDSSRDNRQLEAYYARQGYVPVGTCVDGPYHGILRQKRLDGFLLRHASKDDIDQISQVEAACFPPAEAASKKQLAERVEAYGDCFWLLFDGEKLVSFVDGFVTNEENLTDEMYEKASMHDPNGAWQMIFGVNTIPAYRKQGCAARLLRQAIQDAKGQGRNGLVLTCKAPLVHYYAKFGFIDEGVTENSTHGSVIWNQMRLTF